MAGGRAGGGGKGTWEERLEGREEARLQRVCEEQLKDFRKRTD